MGSNNIAIMKSTSEIHCSGRRARHDGAAGPKLFDIPVPNPRQPESAKPADPTREG
jgi:hypothetical protein